MRQAWLLGLLAGLAIVGPLTLVTSEGSSYASGVSPLTASPQDKKRAQARYEDGTKAFEAKHYPEALKAFQESYDIVASPNSHLMIARTMREQGQIMAAYDELEKVEQEARQLATSDAAKYGPTVDKAVADRDALRKRLGVVTVRVKGDAASLVVGGRVASATKPVAVMPGSVNVVGTATDGRRVTRTVNVAAGSAADVDIDLAQQAPPVAPVPTATATPTPAATAPPPPETPPDSGKKRTSLVPFALIAGGLGAAGLGVGIAFGVKNISTSNSYKDHMTAAQCTQPKEGADWECPEEAKGGPSAQRKSELQAEKESGIQQKKTANILYAVGGGLLGVGAVLLIIDLTRSSSSPSSTGTRSDTSRPGAALAVGWQTVTVQGSF